MSDKPEPMCRDCLADARRDSRRCPSCGSPRLISHPDGCHHVRSPIQGGSRVGCVRDARLAAHLQAHLAAKGRHQFQLLRVDIHQTDLIQMDCLLSS